MADKKISALTAASTPLAGTEVLPIVQGGSTVKVAVSNLTSGRTVTASNLGVNVASPANRIDVDDGGLTVRFSGSPTLALTNAFMHIVGNPANAGGFRLGIGWNVGLDGTNWRTGGDGGNNGGGYIAGNYGDGALDFYTVPNVGGAPQTISDATFGTLKRMRIGATGDISALTGNLVIGTAGKGIDFSANTHAAGMTSELLNDYEEGTWTPTDASGAGLTFTVNFARYTKVGNLVTANGFITFPSTANSSVATISLPYVAANSVVGSAGSDSTSNAVNILIDGGFAQFTVRNNQLGTLTNANLSGLFLFFSATYQV